MQFIELEQRGFVTLITITREAALNALNETVLGELSTALDGLSPDSTRCVILTGRGKAFVAGADIGEMATRGGEAAKAETVKGTRVLRKLEQFPIPTIAAINGYALGGGCELALCCDLRLASEKAVLGLPEVSLGIIPGYGGTQRLPRLIPMGYAKELIYTAKKIDAAQALRIGLVNAVYPPEELLEQAFALAEAISRNAPIGVRAAKRAIDCGRDGALEAGLELELEECSGCFGTEDQRNAMGAFLQKKKPDPFVNR